MRDKFNKFMQGRYGVDELSRFTMGAALVLIILTMFITMFNRNLGSIFDFLGIAAIVYAYFRIFSRNIQQRYAENQKYLQNMGTIIYLKGSAATLIKRLEGSNNPTKKNAPYLQLPGLWTEGPYSQGERQDRDRMSEMPHEIRKEELKCSDM